MLLSGGVDSSVALALLQQQGFSIRAFYLKIWLEDELAHLNECPWEEDLDYAQRVCQKLGVPLETVSLQVKPFLLVVLSAHLSFVVWLLVNQSLQRRDVIFAGRCVFRSCRSLLFGQLIGMITVIHCILCSSLLSISCLPT